MNTGLAEILDYWLEITKPKFLVICGNHPKSPYINNKTALEALPAHSTDLAKYKELAIKIGTSLGLQKKTIQEEFAHINLPEPRIRLLPGTNGNFVVDATYKYFPPLRESVEEILTPIPGRTVWIRNPREWKETKVEPKDTVVITGPRNKLLEVIEEATLNPLEI